VKNSRGGAGDFARRLARARDITPTDATAEPLAFTTAVLAHQEARASNPAVRDAAARVAAEATTNKLGQRYPLLQLSAAVGPIVAELEPAIAALAGAAPGPLAEEGTILAAEPRSEQGSLVEAWLDDTSLVPARSALWIRVSAAPVLELAAGRVDAPGSQEWAGRACPLCGDAPQCSVIVEESGAWLQGSPRYLICARCAAWWAYPRAVCASCGEDDSRLIVPYVEENMPWVRIDACDACRGYMKSFDLRAKGAVAVVPAVDDVATLTLDVWAHENGFSRPASSLAGV
jgi:formate dehydrogenase accessory protein FdhE